jgi:hypothetical protein
MVAATAIEIAMRTSLRISAGLSNENANGAFELSMTTSFLGVGTMPTQNAPRYQVDHPDEDGESPYRKRR